MTGYGIIASNHSAWLWPALVLLVAEHACLTSNKLSLITPHKIFNGLKKGKPQRLLLCWRATQESTVNSESLFTVYSKQTVSAQV